MSQSLVFLETSDIGARYSALAARRLGYDPVFLIDPKNYQADTRAQLEKFRTIRCDTTRIAHMMSALDAAGVHDIAGVMTFLDSRLVPAVELSNCLNVSGLDPAVVILKDKGKVADLIGEFGPRTIVFHRSRIPLNEIREMVDEFGRVVLKPTQTAGGIGNFVLTTEDLENIEPLIRSASLPRALDHGFWVVQAFCEGRLVSLEGYVDDGIVTILGFQDDGKLV
ncbi:MAG: hypothetical protein HC902_08705 [Calothrix sp. SM1_5_4]|nr:hypothetical protein [Calothrix sp. SM1_5_4]